MNIIPTNVSRCDANYKVYTTADAQKMFQGRDIYLWGAGQKGRGFRLALERNGFYIKGFLDSNRALVGSDYMGIPIYHPDYILKNEDLKARSFILAASVDAKNKEMFAQCKAHGLVQGQGYENIQTLSPFYPTVEVTGVCNLRCISCPRGNVDNPPENGGYMSAEDYEKIARKLVADIPFVYLVDLYVWGEPILNKQLPDIIRINNKLGIASGISSNLNNIRGLEEVIKAAPAQIRVSLSGSKPETYEVTHTGGKWERLYKNILKLHELIEKYETDTIVEVYFHVYKNNIKDCLDIAKLCETLGFRMQPVISMLFPDYAMDHCNGKALSKEAEKANDLMLVDLAKLIENAKLDDHKRCLLTRVLPVINWDQTVMPCCNYSYHKIADSYLDISFTDLIQRRTNSDLCMSCQEHSLHRYFDPGYYGDYIRELVLEAEENTQAERVV